MLPRPLTAFLLIATSVWAQPDPVRAWVAAHQAEILREFTDLLTIPNVSSDRANVRQNAQAIRAMLDKRGVSTQLLSAGNSAPVVYGELPAPGAKRTLVFYAHYDGQPVEPREWKTPPFQPSLRSVNGQPVMLPLQGEKLDPETRLYARGASDDKGAIMAMLAALDALKASGRSPAINLKFFFEGEEEAGSANLSAIVKQHANLLQSDAWLICDGPVHQTRRQQVYFGARGVAGLEITVYGAKRELHSGHYGNWAPNPAMMLARLLASMRDDDGRVTVPRFYDGIQPLSDTEKQAIAEAPHNDAELRAELGLARTEGGGRKLLDLLNEPALNLRGLASGAVGRAARNAIPTSATASLDIRLVKGVDYSQAVDRVTAHVRAQGYHVVTREPDDAMRMKYPKIARVFSDGGYNATRTSMDLPIAREIVSAVEKARGPVVRLPTLGGSVPLYVFEEVLKAPMVGIPIANHDNNQHSSNENIRLQNLWDGIETMAALYTALSNPER